MEQPALLPSNKAISIKISLSLFTPTYFAVAAFHSEFKPTQTFTVMHEKFSPPEVICFGIKAIIKNDRNSTGEMGLFPSNHF